MDNKEILRVGGASLIIGALAFIAVFSILAAQFNYPEVLDGPAESVLPALLSMGRFGRGVWVIYALLPLIWLPAGVAAYLALRNTARGVMLLALQFALMASITMMLGLLRWPSIHWRIAEAYAVSDAAQRSILSAMFDGLNLYLGNYIGEFLGELSFSMFFLLSSWAMMKSGASRWLAGIGLITALAGLVGMFRNVTDTVAFVASINNYLLPLWMIVFGVWLFRAKPADPAIA